MVEYYPEIGKYEPLLEGDPSSGKVLSTFTLGNGYDLDRALEVAKKWLKRDRVQFVKIRRVNSDG